MVPILGLMPSATTVLGEKLAPPLAVVFDTQDKTSIVIYYKIDDFFQLSTKYIVGHLLIWK